MRWNIHHENVRSSTPLMAYAIKKIGGPLQRFERHIQSITLRVCDPNTRSHHTPMNARVVVDLGHKAVVVVDHTDKDMYAVIDQVAERVRRAVYRRVSRRTQHKHAA